MPDLNLELTFPKAQVVCCESLPFTVKLTNAGSTPVTLLSLADRAGTLTLCAETGGKMTSVSQHEMLGNLGQGHVHERNPDTVTLNPGEFTAYNSDAITWFGTLSPGTYSFWVKYFASPTKTAETLKTTVTVKESNPVALFSSGDGARLSLTPRRLTWINKSGAGFEIYFTELEARRPTTILSTQGVDKLPSITPVYSSIENVSPPKATYVLWRSGGPAMKAARIDQAGGVTALELALPDAALAPVGSPVCLESGSLAMLCAGITGEHAALIRADAAGKVQSVAINPGTPMGRWRASCIDRKEAAHLVWSSPDHDSLRCVSIQPASDSPGPVRELWRTPDRICHVRADVISDDDSGEDVVVATVLCHDDVNDIFSFVRLNLTTGKPLERALRVTHVGSGFLQVIGSTMTQDGKVYYLFANPDKAVVFAGPGLAELIPLTAEYTKPLTTEMFPFIFASSPLAKEPGVALVYIREGKTIERRMLPE